MQLLVTCALINRHLFFSLRGISRTRQMGVPLTSPSPGQDRAAFSDAAQFRGLWLLQ